MSLILSPPSVTITGPASRPDGLGLDSIGVEEANPAAFGRGDRQAPELGFDLGGMGAEGEAVPPLVHLLMRFRRL